MPGKSRSPVRAVLALTAFAWPTRSGVAEEPATAGVRFNREIRGILAANFPELSTRGADDLAQAMDRSPRFAHSRQPHEVIRQAAYDLTLPPSAAKYTAAGKALAKDDPRILAPVQPPTPAGGEARVPLGKI